MNTWEEICEFMRNFGLSIYHKGEVSAVEPIFFIYEKLVVFCVIVHHWVQCHFRVKYSRIISLTYVNVSPCILKPIIFCWYPSYFNVVCGDLKELIRCPLRPSGPGKCRSKFLLGKPKEKIEKH